METELVAFAIDWNGDFLFFSYQITKSDNVNIEKICFKSRQNRIVQLFQIICNVYA